MIGALLGDYRILAKLGEGGMGVVYLAEDVRLGRQVALKTLSPEFARDPERRKRFLTEARAAAALSHPSVAAVYELEERGDDVFIIFEYVEGRTLRTLVTTHGVPLSQLLKIATQVASALEAAHAKGIVHRDLKPENVMLGSSGEVKVLDFGLARFDSGVFGGGSTTQSFGLTQAGTVMGTVGYMSPEQLEGKPTDFRSDVFSFGVLLYELASGTHPFAGETPASTIANVMAQEPPPLTATNALHPQELERIVRKCMRKSRDERYQSTRELLVDLKNLKRDSGEARVVTPSTTVAQPAMSQAAALRWWRIHSIVFALYCPVLVWFAWLMKDWTPEPMGLTLFFGVTAALTLAGTLRLLHLNFALWNPEALAQQVRRTAPWLMLANAMALLMLMGMAGNIYVQHTGLAAIVTAMCLAGLLTVLVFEPAMVRSAFPEAAVFTPGPLAPAKHVAGIQWVYLLLLASPVVNFALGSKSIEALTVQIGGWPLAGRMAAVALVLVAYGGAIFAAAWSGDAWQGKPEAMRTLRRYFPLFVALDYAAIMLWAGWLALGKSTPRPLYLLVFLFAYLPFHQLKLAREMPGSDVAEVPAAPAAGQRGKALTLAAIQAVFAACYAVLGVAVSRIMPDILDPANPASRIQQGRWTIDVVTALAVAGFFVCASTAIGFLRTPRETAPGFVRFFPVVAAVNILAGLIASLASIPLTDSFLFALFLPVPTVVVTFWERRLARELAPPETIARATGARDWRAPQTWWVAHQLANLLVLAPWVVYWGALTRDYFGAVSRIVFLLLALLVAARWSFCFVLIFTWMLNRGALAAQNRRLAAPSRYVGLAIIGTMLIEAGMAAAKNEVGFGAALGALAIGGLVSVLFIEPALVPPTEG